MVAQTYSQLLKELNKQIKQISGQQEKLRNLAAHSDFARSQEATQAQIKLEGLKDYYEMRRDWGNFLKKCLAAILLFNIGLVILVGLGWLKYNDEWFLRVVLTTNLADIIGLVFLVVKFLFSNQEIKLDNRDIKSSKN